MTTRSMPARPLDPDSLAEAGEAGHRTQPAPDDLEVHSGAQAPAQPALDQIAQPRLRHGGEVQCLVAVVAEAAQLPDVAGNSASQPSASTRSSTLRRA